MIPSLLIFAFGGSSGDDRQAGDGGAPRRLPAGCSLDGTGRGLSCTHSCAVHIHSRTTHACGQRDEAASVQRASMQVQAGIQQE